MAKSANPGKDPGCPHCKGQRAHGRNGRKACKQNGSSPSRQTKRDTKR